MPPELPITARDIPIAESFTSIQGEGKLTGVPSWFVRTSGCNLRCAWCDTPYASWRPEGRSRAIEDLVHEAAASGVRHAVVTGGEPMMFPQVVPLTEALAARGMHITIETAGTVFRPVRADLMSISPKLANSTPAADAAGPWAARHDAARINLSALQALLDAYPERQLKFVVTGPLDVPEIERLLAGLRGWQDPDILLMPEGVTSPTPEASRLVLDECRRHNWRYCHRLHIELFGNTRGT
jgi:7-carboxy-7-deazaguanine synthase